MEQERCLSICICKEDGNKTGNICFIATGFNILTDKIICVDIFIIPRGIEQRITEIRRSRTSRDVNFTLHSMYNIPIKELTTFDTIKLKNSNTFKGSILNIFDDLIDNQPVIRDSILRHIDILLRPDTSLREKLIVIDFLRELDTFKYGKDEVGRFQTRCTTILTCMVIFLDVKLSNDIITTFNGPKEDRIIEVIIDKSKEKINKRKTTALYR